MNEKVPVDGKKGMNFPAVSATAVSSKTTYNKTSLLKNNLFSLEDIYKGENGDPSISPACQVLRFYDREVRVFLFSLLQKHLIDYQGQSMIDLPKAPYKVNKNTKKKFQQYFSIYQVNHNENLNKMKSKEEINPFGGKVPGR